MAARRQPADAELLLALERAVADFRDYLGAPGVRLPRGMDARTRAAWRAEARTPIGPL